MFLKFMIFIKEQKYLIHYCQNTIIQLKLFKLNQNSHDLGLFFGCEQIENIYVYWFLDQINAKLYPFKTIADTIYLPKKNYFT